MATNKSDNSPVLLIVIVIAALYFFGGSGGDPDVPTPVTPETTELSKKIAAAMSTVPDGTCLRYGAFYSAAASYVSRDSGPASMSKRRDVVFDAKGILGLQSTPGFTEIVVNHLDAYSSGSVDRDAYTAALRFLSDACVAAE